jgi:hypothetical protein
MTVLVPVLKAGCFKYLILVSYTEVAHQRAIFIYALGIN